jgi:hypothetical protein
MLTGPGIMLTGAVFMLTGAGQVNNQFGETTGA